MIEPGLDGVRRIYGFVQLPNTQARFAVGFDAETVLRRANYGMWTALAELGAMILLALFGIWFGGEKLLVRPIRAFAAGGEQDRSWRKQIARRRSALGGRVRAARGCAR